MKYKLKQGGIVKLQNAGFIPSVGLQQIVEAANSGDTKKAEELKNQFQLEQARRIYADHNKEAIDTKVYHPNTGYITQGRDKLYKNAYDRWTANTAKGQEFKRFVDGPLSFFVENGLATAAGMGTLSRLAQGTKYANTLSTASKVAPLAEDVLSALGTSYFATRGLSGIKEDIWGKRKFNPLITALDATMTVPAITAIKPTINGMKELYNSGNMWARALRGEPRAIHRVKRVFNNNLANTDYRHSLSEMDTAVDKAITLGKNAQDDKSMLYSAIDAAENPNVPIYHSVRFPLSDISYQQRPVGKIYESEFIPETVEASFTNPLTGEKTIGRMFGVRKKPDLQISILSPNKLERLNIHPERYFAKADPLNVVEKGITPTILENDASLTQAIAKYRDMVNARLKGKAIVGGSTHSIAEGLHSGVPGDLELYTKDKFLDDIIKDFQIKVTDRSTRRIKGTSPYAINGEVDLHTLDPHGPDVEELGALINPEEHAAKRVKDMSRSFRRLFGKKVKPANKKEIAEYFDRLQSDPEFLTDLMRKNNLQGIGGTDQAQAKFARRQTEMGLKLPLEDLDRTFEQIEAQVPGFVTFDQAYPNFDYTNVEGNKAFLRYFGLPEEFATDFERMKRLYRQQHEQFTPSIREFTGAKSMAQARRMGRKNAQYDSGDASGAGGNMLISSNGGGFGGSYGQNTVAQYLPTYHPENIKTGGEYVNAIEKTKLFERPISPEEDAALKKLLGPDYLVGHDNLSDVLQAIGRKDLKNPKLNPTIQKVSKIIDVPRMTGVRYDWDTNSIYTGNLSGEPISETFSLGRPFEFGRSFNDVLAPPRNEVSYGRSRSVKTLEELPLEKMTKSNAELLRQRMQEWKEAMEDPKTFAQKNGFRYIDNVADAKSEIEKLEKVPIQKIGYGDVHDTYHNLVGNKLNRISDIVYDWPQKLFGGAVASGLLGLIGGATYFYANDNKQINLRSGWYDPYFRKAYENSPEYFPYTYKREKNEEFDTDTYRNIWRESDKAWKDWYKKNKTAIERDWKERRPIRVEKRRIEKQEAKQERKEKRAKKKAEKQKEKEEKKKNQ